MSNINPPADATQYILNELARRLDAVTSALEAGMSRLDLTYVRKDVYDQWKITADAEHLRISDRSSGLEVRIKEMEDARTWLVRLIAGFIIMGVLGAVFVASKIGA